MRVSSATKAMSLLDDGETEIKMYCTIYDQIIHILYILIRSYPKKKKIKLQYDNITGGFNPLP